MSSAGLSHNLLLSFLFWYKSKHTYTPRNKIYTGSSSLLHHHHQLSLPLPPPRTPDDTKMSEHEQNHGSDSEEDAQSSPTLAPTNPIPANTTLTNRVSTGPSSKEAPELPRRATRIGTAVHPPFVWPQPRGGSHTAGESTRAAGRRLPAAIRTAAVATQESMCIV